MSFCFDLSTFHYKCCYVLLSTFPSGYIHVFATSVRVPHTCLFIGTNWPPKLHFPKTAVDQPTLGIKTLLTSVSLKVFGL